MRLERWSRRLLLRALPRAFRARHADEMDQVLEEALADRGALGRAAVWMAVTADTLRTAVRLRVRSLGSGGWSMSGLGADLRYVLRVLLKSPGFALVAVLSLGLGIGANAAIFGAVTSLLRDPLPVESPEELAVVHWRHPGEMSISQISSGSYTDPATGLQYRTNYSYPLYRALREAAPDGVTLFAFNFVRGISVGVGDQPPTVANGLMVDGDYFPGLRPGMALGRGLSAEDDAPTASAVVVLSHSFWMRAFGGDPSALGRTIRVNGYPAEIVGVTADGYEGLSKGGFFPVTDVTMTLSAQTLVAPRWGGDTPLRSDDGTFWVRLMARIPRGHDREELGDVLTSVLAGYPLPVTEDGAGRPEVLVTRGDRGPVPIGEETSRALWLLMGVVGVVLLIACVNLASLMLARGVARQREMAVRRALGGGRVRLLRQTLMETLVLAVAGTGLGLVLMAVGARWITTMLTWGLGSSAFGSTAVGVEIRPAVVLASVLAGIVACVLSGLLPAIRLSDLDPGEFLKHRTSGASTPRLRLGRVLIGVQIAVSVPLVVGAFLLLRTVSNLDGTELGFDPRGLVMFQLDPGYTRVPEERHHQLYLDVLERLSTLPGVRSVSFVENPLMSGIVSNTGVEVDGERKGLWMNAVGPGFFQTMEMRVVAGRVPGLEDVPGAPRIGVLNEEAVRVFFAGSSPIGRTLRVGRSDVTIVGVVADSRYERQRADVHPTLFDSGLQRPGFGGHNVVIRSDLPAARLDPLVRQAVREVDPDLPVPEMRTQVAQMERTSARERVFTRLLLGFGAFALLLASIGLHGVTSYAVARRTSEIGVRVAVGARPAQVLWLVLRQVVVLSLAGLLLGVPAALAAGPLVGSLLYGVAPTDPVAIASASVIMVLVAATAGYFPARRAARVDALVALRSE